MNERKLNCKKCGRYLATSIGSVVIRELICAKCKTRNAFTIIARE